MGSDTKKRIYILTRSMHHGFVDLLIRLPVQILPIKLGGAEVTKVVPCARPPNNQATETSKDKQSTTMATIGHYALVTTVLHQSSEDSGG